VEGRTTVAKTLFVKAQGLEVGGSLGDSLAIQTENDLTSWLAIDVCIAQDSDRVEESKI